jgi:hypothetical protein
MVSIKNKNWLSLAIAPVGIFLYGMSSSALLEERELSFEEGYPNFQIPVKQIMNDSPENDENSSAAPSIPKSDYEDFFSSPDTQPPKKQQRKD